MLSVALNPGFVPIIAALLVLASPREARAPIMAGAAIIALWLVLDYEFGAPAAMAQMGLPVVLLNLDALNRIFGIGLSIALVAIALHSSARRNRYEDAAILLLAGGAASALFVGDLVSFVASASLAGLAAAWVVLASSVPGANRSGVRLLVWQGLEGLLFLIGVALHLTSGAASSIFARMDVRQLGDACIFAALLIRTAAPLAHVWFKDVVSHASPTGAAALTAFTSMLGVYALARLFPAEPLLIPIGAAMIMLGAFYAAAEDDLRRAGAYGMIAQTGVCVSLIGIGSPLAISAAEGHAFASILAFVALQLTFGAVFERMGDVRLSKLAGVARAMPITVTLSLAAGLAVAAAPGFALHATQTVAVSAAAIWELRWLWLLIGAAPGAMFVALVLSPALAMHRPANKRAVFAEAPFGMLLGAGLAVFFCLAVGVAPRWLYSLLPTEIAFDPFASDAVGERLQLLGAAGLMLLALRALRATPELERRDVLDVDSLYRGPVAEGARWAGVLLLRIYGAAQYGFEHAMAALQKRIERNIASFDQPYARFAPGAAQALAVTILMLLLWFIR